MSTAGLGSVTDLVTLLSANWTSSNTDGRTPRITDNLSTPWEDLDFGMHDIIYLKYDAETVKTGMYALDFYHDVMVTIEVMTTKLGSPTVGYDHFKKLLNEAARIIKANARQAGYARTVVQTTRSRYVKERGIFLGTLEINLLKVLAS